MIARFKKSKTGQLAIVAFTCVSITAAIVIWFYESIRLPTLSGQLAFRDDKIKAADTDLQKEKDKARTLDEQLKNERAETEKARTLADTSAVEIKRLSTQLKDVQEMHARVVAELNSVKLSLVQTNVATKTSSEAPRALGFPQIISLTSDQEDAAILAVDKPVSDLRLAAYGMMRQEFDSVQKETPATMEAVKLYAERLVTVPREYWEFRVTLEQLRTHGRELIHLHYHDRLKSAETLTTDRFLETIREKPEVLNQIADFARRLQRIETFTKWNSNASASATQFLETNRNRTANIKIENSSPVSK